MSHKTTTGSKNGKSSGGNSCLSCGTGDNMKRRRYCSVDCRQKLRQKLNMRTGLLKALNVRYATFYFTDTVIVMDVLLYGSRDLLSFIYPRTPEKKPGEDFSRMANLLGNLWWTEKNRSNKAYLASKQVLDRANKNNDSLDAIKPLRLTIPSVKGASLLHLRFSKSDLDTDECVKMIKSTYREQAKKHHPDLGGNSATFRKIHAAYEDLLDWAENPTFIRRSGFSDKWFYDGEQNRWVQPLPEI
jgi:hypothetical protein